jgi:hypothetical protein
VSKDIAQTLAALERNLPKAVAAILNDCAFKIQKRVGTQEFVHWRSRRKPIAVDKAKPVGDLLMATVRGSSKWDWGHVLIGPAGTTTIRPNKGKFLAIPTDFARRGVKSPKAYAGLRIFAGIMWGKAGWGGAGTGGGLRQHRAAGEKLGKEALVPMFILKGSVVVRRRIIPAEQVAWIQPYFQAQLKAKALVPANA